MNQTQSACRKGRNRTSIPLTNTSRAGGLIARNGTFNQSF
jgi:hypothetical protein